jgi:hypothetical protein
MEEDKITMIKLKVSTREKLKKLKAYPKESNDEVLIRLITKEVNKT